MRDRHEVLIDEARCIGCGLCREDCPAANIVVEQGKAAVISQDCLMCGHCVAICPQAAVTMTGFEEEPRELDAGAPTALDPDRLQQALGARRSIRRFADRPVPDDVFARIVEAGRLTPTAKNEQDVSFVVLRDDIARFEARAVRLFRRVMPFVRLTSSMARRTSIDDRFFFGRRARGHRRDRARGHRRSAGRLSMELMAQAHGLGVLYGNFFTMAARLSRESRRRLKLGRKQKVVTALVLGYPAVRYRRTAPKEAAAISWK